MNGQKNGLLHKNRVKVEENMFANCNSFSMRTTRRMCMAYQLDYDLSIFICIKCININKKRVRIKCVMSVMTSE